MDGAEKIFSRFSYDHLPGLTLFRCLLANMTDLWVIYSGVCTIVIGSSKYVIINNEAIMQI